MSHDLHAGELVIGPGRDGAIRRGQVLMVNGDELLVEWRDGTLSTFCGQDVDALARQDIPDAACDAPAANVGAAIGVVARMAGDTTAGRSEAL